MPNTTQKHCWSICSFSIKIEKSDYKAQNPFPFPLLTLSMFGKSLLYDMCLQLKPAGTLCRESSNSCDLPEFCTGANAHCPANVYLHDGHACHNVEGYCYNGICQTHEQQCITLWGPGKSTASYYIGLFMFLPISFFFF